jgi:hypothetical protein
MRDTHPLHVYVRDHFAGATAGLELAKRMARHTGKGTLPAIADEIESDRETLREVLVALDLRPAAVKTTLGWLAEKASRVPLRDRMTGHPESSAVLELETLIAGVSGKLQLWRALADVASSDPRLRQFDFVELERRAEGQRSRLEELHSRAAREALIEARPDDEARLPASRSGSANM